MTAWSLVTLGSFVILACWEDCRRRRISMELVLTAMVLGGVGWVVGWGSVSALGAALGWALAVLGRLPQGDRQAAGVIGWYVGLSDVAGALAVAYLGLLGTFWLFRHEWVRWPGGWPFFPYLAAGTCAILGVGLFR